MLQAAVGEGQQRSVQGTLGILQDGIVLVDVLHYLRVKLILLKYTSEKKNIHVMITSTYTVKNTLLCAFYMPAANLETSQWVRWLTGSVCLSRVTGVDLTRVTIQLWQLSKQQEGQVMTQQTALAWLTRYILSTGVNEFSVRVFVSFSADVDRCLPAVGYRWLPCHCPPAPVAH